MDTFFNIAIGGLATGAVYALLAVGFSLVFNVTRILNLAQGAFVAMGALTMYSMERSAHLPLGLALVVSLAIMAVAMALVEWVVIRPAEGKISHTNLLMLMGGMLTALEGAAFLIWGSNPYSLPPFTAGPSLAIGGVYIPLQDFWIAGALVLCLGGLALFLYRTRAGRAFRATAENRQAARLMGINPDRVVLLAFASAAILGVLAGAVLAPITSLDYSSMASFTNSGLIAVTIGGLGTVGGAAAGGLFLGLVEALFTGYVSSVFGTAFSLVALVVVLVWKPEGLLGRARGVRTDVAERSGNAVMVQNPLRPRTTRAWAGAGVVALVVVPFLPGVSGYFAPIDITGVFCLTIVGLWLLTGVAGQVSLGQAGFMAVGGYISSILMVRDGVSPLLALLAGVAGSVVVAVVLGLAGSRVRGMYLAIVTLAFGILAESVASGLSITGGPSGLVGIPSFSVAGFSFNTGMRFYYLIWVLVALALVVSGNIVRSNLGRALRAMHADETGVRSVGFDVRRHKVVVFVLSAVLASVAGSLYASYFHYFEPSMVGSAESLELITMLVVGGTAMQAGPLLGVTLLTFFPQVFQGLANYEPLVDGVLLVAFLRYLPGGLIGGLVDLAQVPGARLRAWRARSARSGPGPSGGGSERPVTTSAGRATSGVRAVPGAGSTPVSLPAGAGTPRSTWQRPAGRRSLGHQHGSGEGDAS